jgi:hypothetical protein
MVNFEKIVETLLIEGESDDTTISSDVGLSKNQALSLQNFLKDVSIYQQLQGKFNEHYNQTNTFPMISQEELKQLGSIVADKSLRSTKGSQFFPKLEITYPLIDLLAELAKVFKRGGEVAAADKPEEAIIVINAFYNNLKNTPSKIPLDYQPINAWAQTVKQDYYSKQRGSLGQIRLSELPKELSIYGTIKHLLNLREQAVAFKYPKEKIPNPKQFIADIFLKPNFYIRGEKAVPSDKTLREFYDDVTSDMLVGVSTAAYELFKQQALSHVGMDENTKTPKLKNEEQLYAIYIGATSDKASVVKWKEFVTESNFNLLYRRINSLILTESKTIFPTVDGIMYKATWDDRSDPKYLSIVNNETNKEIYRAEGDDNLHITLKDVQSIEGGAGNLSVDSIGRLFDNKVGGLKELIAKYRDNPKILKYKPSSNSSERSGESKFFEINPDLYLYSIGNIEKYQQQVPPAGVLYEKLENFADFVKKETDVDWLGVMSKATSALRGLADASPNLGGGGLTG